MKKLLTIAVLFIITLQFHACDDIDILSPPGPAGMSAYKEWVKAVESGEIPWSSGTDLANFFKFLKGDKGEAGASAYASWVELIKTGTVENPHKPGSKWDPSKDAPADFYSFLTGAKGDAGLTPHINAKGNWQIGTVDTGIPAKGQTGAPGVPGLPGTAGSVVEINDAGNWEIDGADTGISAQGKDGVGGTAGRSAYEIWVAEVEAGNIKDKDGNLWPPGSTTLGDFWSYLSGTSAEPKDATLIQYIKNYPDPSDANFEVFEFQTDPEAVITMQYLDIKVQGVGGADGKCIMRFPSSPTDDRPVVTSALKTGKGPSASLLLIVKKQLPFAKIAREAIWTDEFGTELTSPAGEYKPDDPIPYIYLKSADSHGSRVKIPIEMENVMMVSAFALSEINFGLEYVAEDNEFKKGHLLIYNFDPASWMPGSGIEGIVVLQLSGLHDNIKFVRFKVKVAP